MDISEIFNRFRDKMYQKHKDAEVPQESLLKDLRAQLAFMYYKHVSTPMTKADATTLRLVTILEAMCSIEGFDKAIFMQVDADLLNRLG